MLKRLAKTIPVGRWQQPQLLLARHQFGPHVQDDDSETPTVKQVIQSLERMLQIITAPNPKKL